MSLGIKARVLIAYLEYDTNMILESVRAYTPDAVITFHDIFSNQSESAIRMKFADYFQKCMVDLKPNISYCNFEIKGKDYQTYAKHLESAVEYVNELYGDPEVYINISAGPNEFSAAAALCSAVHTNVTMFTTIQTMSNIPIDMVDALFCNDGVPVGSSAEIECPCAVETYKAEAPSKPLVIGLRLLDEQLSSGKPLMAKDMVSLFIKKGIWMREKASANDNVFYLRDFVDKWVSNGWVVRGKLRNQYRITQKGRVILDTYYNNIDFEF